MELKIALSFQIKTKNISKIISLICYLLIEEISKLLNNKQNYV